MPTNKTMKRLAFWALACSSALLLVFACVQGGLLAVTQAHKAQASQAWAQRKNTEIAQGLSKKLAVAAQAAETLAGRLSNATCKPCDVEATLHAFYLQHPEFSSVGVAYEAARSGTEFRLYAPFIRRNSPGARVERLDKTYDYLASPESTEENPQKDGEHWYRVAAAQKNRWLPAFYERALAAYVVRYTATVHDEQKQEIGLVFVDIGLDDLADEIRRHDIRNNNYVSLHNAAGAELFHSLKNTAQIIEHMSARSGSGTAKEGPHEGLNVLTGEPAWTHSSQVSSTGWVVDTVVDQSTVAKADLPASHDGSRRWLLLSEEHRVAWVALFVAVAMLAYGCHMLRRRRTGLRDVWIDSAFCAIVLALGVVSIWVLESGKSADVGTGSLLLSNQAAVEEYKRNQATAALAARHRAPRFVPAGLFIQSIEFKSSHNVEVTGYIWHRYAEGEASDYAVGTVFPEAISTEINEAKTETVNGETLKSWYFKAELRENFTPTLYPFDRQSVWIRMWHEQLGENIKLVPDFKAYDSLNTRSLPGLEKDFVLSGWSLFQSYFEVREKKYNTRLGSVSGTDNSAVSELYFDIELSRNLLNPFLAHLFPLAVVMLMLFAIVVTMSINRERSDLLGFNAAAVVASCSALFFVALISHVQMRDELASNTVVYLEFFYLTAYFSILLITANAVLLSLNVQLRLIRFHDNILPKLFYWPSVLLVLFICTAWIFW